MQACECVVKAKAKLQRIRDEISENKPDEDVRLGVAHRESQGESSRGSGRQPGGRLRVDE